MEKEVFEIFQEFEKLTKRSDKIKFLQEQGKSVPAIKDICRGIYDPRLKFVLPEGKPPYNPNKPESVPSTLRKLHRQFGDFVEGSVLHKCNSSGSNKDSYNSWRVFTPRTH